MTELSALQKMEAQLRMMRNQNKVSRIDAPILYGSERIYPDDDLVIEGEYEVKQND